MNLEQYFSKYGWGSQTRLADSIGAFYPDVSNWKKGKTFPPSKYCKAIELATGGEVTVKDLRPHDWIVFWPELAEGKG